MYTGFFLIFNSCPTRCDLFSLLHFCRQLYMFRVLTPIIRSSCNCNYSFWYWLTGSTTVRSLCWVGTEKKKCTQRSSRKVPVIVARCQWNLYLLDKFSKNIQIPNFMKNRPVGAESFNAEGQTASTKLVDAFSEFCENWLIITTPPPPTLVSKSVRNRIMSHYTCTFRTTETELATALLNKLQISSIISSIGCTALPIYDLFYDTVYLNEGITKCLDTYCNINILRQHNCFYYTR